jgi:hypothetical protein
MCCMQSYDTKRKYRNVRHPIIRRSKCLIVCSNPRTLSGRSQSNGFESEKSWMRNRQSSHQILYTHDTTPIVAPLLDAADHYEAEIVKLTFVCQKVDSPNSPTTSNAFRHRRLPTPKKFARRSY